MKNEIVLQANDLATGYGEKVVSQALNLTLVSGELVCLLGPNGSGKSTLLRTLTALQKKLHGSVNFHGRPLDKFTPRELAQKISVVLTERINTGHLTVYSLVALGRHPYTGWLGTLSATDHEVIQSSLHSVGVFELAQVPVNTLSDGQKQKVMIARALAQDPELLVLDEPTAFLDLPHRVDVMRILHQLAHDKAKSILLSTHDLDLALRHADRFWLMDQQGNIHDGGPEDMVLSGTVSEVFGRDGIQFDPITGTFLSSRYLQTPVSVSGKGLSYEWTQRALSRAGYLPSEVDSANIHVFVEGENEPSNWIIKYGTDESHFQSIYDVITYLKTIDP